ncbi:hypothetical protein GCM10010339_19380 [Streptomyces alanosinicus]|uniref:Uncharacterized protein n=1 Tax=Streptomyces alanosinicus TaxID=68171 RepID=A0A918YFJ3_9ACTN|nr:hypothetical protein GCM10010339_19380 [Streptomyces alanosinicus]
MVRGTDLADDEYVERGAERSGDRLGDGDAAARQGEHEGIDEGALIAQLAQQSGEFSPGFGTVPEAHG